VTSAPGQEPANGQGPSPTGISEITTVEVSPAVTSTSTRQVRSIGLAGMWLPYGASSPGFAQNSSR